VKRSSGAYQENHWRGRVGAVRWSVALDQELEASLQALEDKNLRRNLLSLAGATTVVHLDGRELVSFSSNDYLGLASSTHALHAPSGAGASRLVTGNLRAHEELEADLAAFVGRDAALLFSSGYAANVGTVAALVGAEDVVFSDSLNHASLIDGIRLSRARKHVFRHDDVDHLRSLLVRHRRAGRRALLVVESVYSMDGGRAPLGSYADLAREHDAVFMVDEAHSLGVLGPHGRGAAFDLEPDVLVGTLGKAFGAAGAFVAGSHVLREWLVHRARSFVFSTAVAPPMLETIGRCLRHVREADDLRARVLDNAQLLRSKLVSLGLEVLGDRTPIVPVVLGAASTALSVEHQLFERGFLARAIRPPTVPDDTSRIRLVTTAAHRAEQIDALADAFGELRFT